MFIIADKTLLAENVENAYISNKENGVWIMMTNKDNARQFKTKEEIKKYIKSRKLQESDLEIIEISIPSLWD